MKNNKNFKGNTLIETLVYISLLSILMIGVFSSIYSLIGSEQKSSIDSTESNLILLKNYHE